jgi:hypothetical protein
MTRSGIFTLTEPYMNRNRNNIKFRCHNPECKNGEKGERATFSERDKVFKKVSGGPTNRRTVLYCLKCARRFNHI